MTFQRSQKLPIPYTRIRELNIFTVSNFLSLSRVLLLPFIYFCLTLETHTGDYWAFGLMLLAAFTDILDGMLARGRDTISSFGKIIDPLADKICLGAIVVFLIALRNFPVWLVILILVRDTVIVLIGVVLIRRYKIVFPSKFWGKLYSFSVALLIAAYTLRLSWRISLEWDVLRLLGWVVLILLAISSLSYIVKVFRYIRTHQRHQRINKNPQVTRPKEPQAIL